MYNSIKVHFHSVADLTSYAGFVFHGFICMQSFTYGLSVP